VSSRPQWPDVDHGRAHTATAQEFKLLRLGTSVNEGLLRHLKVADRHG
jgi:hypothetical protein